MGIDVLVSTVLYGHLKDWDIHEMKDDIVHYSLTGSRIDIWGLTVLRSSLLFFVFAYSNHRIAYEWNLFTGVLFAAGSTGYGVFKLILSPKERHGIDHGWRDGRVPAVIVWFIVWIWVEVIIFWSVRRKKIRIKLPNVQKAYGALRRRGSRIGRERSPSFANRDSESSQGDPPRRSMSIEISVPPQEEPHFGVILTSEAN